MLVFEEVSVVGRKMMGRIDSRTQQAVADRNLWDLRHTVALASVGAKHSP